jgi:hypothetical protein
VFGLRQFGGDFFALNPTPGRSRYLGPLAIEPERAWVMLVGWSLVAADDAARCGR